MEKFCCCLLLPLVYRRRCDLEWGVWNYYPSTWAESLQPDSFSVWRTLQLEYKGRPCTEPGWENTKKPFFFSLSLPLNFTECSCHPACHFGRTTSLPSFAELTLFVLPWIRALSWNDCCVLLSSYSDQTSRLWLGWASCASFYCLLTRDLICFSFSFS